MAGDPKYGERTGAGGWMPRAEKTEMDNRRVQIVKFFLATANFDELKKGASWGIVDGVTTNPSLIAKEARPIEEQVRMICEIVDGDISAEVISTEAGAM